MVVTPCMLVVVVGPGPRWASRVSVRAQSGTFGSTSGVFWPRVTYCPLDAVVLSCERWIVSWVLGGVT